MSDEAENASSRHVFYARKSHLVHWALNIALAPVLLYLLGAWKWPPVLPHYIVFAITFLLGLRFAQRRWSTPQLILDDEGLFCGKFYAADHIYRTEPSWRSVTLTMLADGAVKTKVIGLGWAGRHDCQQIQQLLADRFQREVPEQKS